MDYADVLFRNVSDGIFLVDYSGHLLKMNPAAGLMVRATPEDCVGNPVGRMFADFPILVELMLGKGGRLRRVNLPAGRAALGICENNEHERLIILQDITERESLNSRREAVLHTLVHDLRNPISAMLGFAELVDVYGELNEQQAKFLNHLQRTARKLQFSLRDLTDLAWVEAGMPLEAVPVDLAQEIETAIIDLETDAARKQQSIVVSAQDPMPLIMGDPARLRQVIHNLLQNAINYSDCEELIAVHAFESRGLVRVTVADRGFGIRDEEIDLVFNRLYRSDDPWVASVPGGGVGLTMARAIIKRHGGHIKVNSTVGRGSRFTFSLPVAV